MAPCMGNGARFMGYAEDHARENRWTTARSRTNGRTVRPKAKQCCHTTHENRKGKRLARQRQKKVFSLDRARRKRSEMEFMGLLAASMERCRLETATKTRKWQRPTSHWARALQTHKMGRRDGAIFRNNFNETYWQMAAETETWLTFHDEFVNYAKWKAGKAPKDLRIPTCRSYTTKEMTPAVDMPLPPMLNSDGWNNFTDGSAEQAQNATNTTKAGWGIVVYGPAMELLGPTSQAETYSDVLKQRRMLRTSDLRRKSCRLDWCHGRIKQRCRVVCSD